MAIFLFLTTRISFPFRWLIKAVIVQQQQLQPSPDHPRQQRWNQLNAILGMNKKTKKRPCPDDEGSVSTGYSYTTWSDVSGIFVPIRICYIQPVNPIPDTDYEILSVVLSWIVKSYH